MDPIFNLVDLQNEQYVTTSISTISEWQKKPSFDRKKLLSQLHHVVRRDQEKFFEQKLK